MNGNRKDRKWVTKAIIVFIAVLLVLTFFSNTIMNLFIPKVVGKKTYRGNLSYTNNSTAVVEPVNRYKVEAIAGRKVDRVLVTDYDEVKKDDVLLTLEPVEDRSALDALKKELQDLQREEEYAARTPSGTDYASLRSNVSRAQYQLNEAKEELAQARNKKDKISTAQKIIDKNQKNLPSLTAEVQQASATVEDLNKKIDEVASEIESRQKRINEIEPPEGAEPDPEIAEEITRLEEEILTRKTKKDELSKQLTSAVKRLEDASSKLSDCNEAIAEAQKALQEAEGLPSVSSAKVNYEEAQAALQSAKKTLSDAQANDGIARDKARDASEERKSQIAALKIKIEELENSYEVNELRAPVEGTVFAVTVADGDDMEEGTVLVVIPKNTEYTVTFRFDAESVKNLTPGMSIATDTYWVESCKILSIKSDPDNPREKRLVKCMIKADVVYPGESVTGILGKTDSEYECLIMSGAVFEDNGGSFVYVIDETRSPFGNRYQVRRVDVDVLATDGAVSAISGEGLDSVLIVVRSEEPLENGQRVRLEDYSGK